MSDLINIYSQNGNLVVSSREVAKNFGKEHFNVVRDIENLIENEPLKNEELKYFIPETFNHRGNEYKEYLLTRDGFSLLVMGFTGKKALEWKLKYIEAFNKMEETIKKGQSDMFSQLSPQTQVLINLELGLNKLESEVNEAKQEIQNMRDVITLNPQSWRKETSTLINKMALNAGGYENIKLIREEIYTLLNQRLGVDVQTRLTNKRRRMADEGVSKSKRDKLTIVDVIADDKKLIEGYTAIVKEMAIKYKVA
ncbi:Rha family transcriptional regulator [Tissierella sp. MSJ-40]|uniref:Rha family transcriptional regulator n=2 Tax=Tissierella simiarum TaxID=2841534 RepID=A0ABS6EBG1_9FIRM|nr:Rha family transcriptional regulator [Tissierella simiarum]MBU5440268.1 Rha family transcriptional regulator [Tissierella simiarum]